MSVISAAVVDIVRQQKEAGVDVPSDGEMGKISYATYIKDRLDGFGGTGNSFVFQDIEDYPDIKTELAGRRSGYNGLFA